MGHGVGQMSITDQGTTTETNFLGPEDSVLLLLFAFPDKSDILVGIFQRTDFRLRVAGIASNNFGHLANSSLFPWVCARISFKKIMECK